MTDSTAEGSPGTKADAQKRADQIEAFARELGELEREGVLRLEPGDRARIDAHHASVLERLAGVFDVDRTERQRRMSLGMRIASLVGAVTLSAAVVLFFNRVWGLLSTPAQLSVLVAAPLVWEVQGPNGTWYTARVGTTSQAYTADHEITLSRPRAVAVRGVLSGSTSPSLVWRIT